MLLLMAAEIAAAGRSSETAGMWTIVSVDIGGDWWRRYLGLWGRIDAKEEVIVGMGWTGIVIRDSVP